MTGFWTPTKKTTIFVAGILVPVALIITFCVIFLRSESNENENEIDCDVTILGAGFAGIYAAYQLANRSGASVCLIEKLDRFGGRIYDVSGWPGGPIFGNGALRLIGSQITMLALATELGISLQSEEQNSELLRVRGQFFYRETGRDDINKMCHQVFPQLTCEYPGYTNNTHQAMISIVKETYEANTSIADQYFDYPNLIASIFGDEGLEFIRESFRFVSFHTSVSVHSILDYLYNEIYTTTNSHIRYYPVGGMSQFINRMLDHANRSNVRIFSSQPVHEIYTQSSDGDTLFHIKTKNHLFKATSVLCAIDPIHLRDVRGNIADSITEMPHFKMILPRSAAIVTVWWPERWWETSPLYQNLSRVVSHENCFSSMDIPTFPYGRDQNVTRAVYDDGVCLEMWQGLIESGDKHALSKVVVTSLSNVFTDVKIPEPRALDGFFHHNAWHYQVANSKISNQEIFKWSLNPLAGKNFSLIGEAYNLKYATWCDGALKSTMSALTKLYGFKYPCLNDIGSPAICSSSRGKKNMIKSDVVPNFLF